MQLRGRCSVIGVFFWEGLGQVGSSEVAAYKIFLTTVYVYGGVLI